MIPLPSQTVTQWRKERALDLLEEADRTTDSAKAQRLRAVAVTSLYWAAIRSALAGNRAIAREILSLKERVNTLSSRWRTLPTFWSVYAPSPALAGLSQPKPKQRRLRIGLSNG